MVIGWEELPDLSTVKTREALEALFFEKQPDAKPARIANWVGQIWAFKYKIELGDLVVLPLKRQRAIAIGKITSPYQYRPELPPDARHTRQVKWIRKDLPRQSFDRDLLFSLGAFKTVCQIQRNNAEERIQAILEGRTSKLPSTPSEIAEPVVDAEPPQDLEEFTRDQIGTYIGQRFRGHDLARLVTGLLNAQGYKTEMASPGADGGVDIIAGQGLMGFDPPRLCVQVKSSDQPVDVDILRALQGTVQSFGAEHGLLVAWGGFKQSVLTEARKGFFKIRLWDSGDLVNGLMQNYDKLPEDIKAELPLKRIWMLVPAE
ncbi:MAG: restriction endonuclease [Chloroflexota bacterium]|nr:restriction endonuclease [Chloroflexota bacterium]